MFFKHTGFCLLIGREYSPCVSHFPLKADSAQLTHSSGVSLHSACPETCFYLPFLQSAGRLWGESEENGQCTDVKQGTRATYTALIEDVRRRDWDFSLLFSGRHRRGRVP